MSTELNYSLLPCFLLCKVFDRGDAETPNNRVPGQVKCFIDRTFSYLAPDYVTNPKCSRVPPGKKLEFIVTQGALDEGMFAEVPKRYETFLKRVLALAEVRLIRACGVGGRRNTQEGLREVPAAS